MRKHNGMRPQDLVILLKICTLDQANWQLAVLASSLHISISEVSESLHRSQFGGLIDGTKKRVNRQNLYEFLCHGLRFVYPVQPGGLVRGIPTAHSHPFLKEKFVSSVFYVWPDPQSDFMGYQIDPLYSKQVEAVKGDSDLFLLLALTDVLRTGKVREVQFAKEELKRLLLHG